jgi:putative zinc finger/helix-turn-helix YgiT family protein
MKERCPTCNKGTLKRGTTRHEVAISKVVFVGELRAEVCSHCDEALVWAGELGNFEHAIAAQLVKLGLRTGPAFKFMRKVFGIRAVDLAELLGVAAETVSRWENGKPDALAFAALGGIVQDRLAGTDFTAQRLRAIQHPVSRKRIEVEVPPTTNPAAHEDHSASKPKRPSRSRNAA